MRNLRTFAVCFLGAIAMAACAGSENAESNKGALAEKGYAVSLYTAEQYKTLQTATIFTEAKGLTYHLVAGKKNDDGSALVFAAWYFASIDQASAWNEANTAKLASFYSEEKGTSLGQRNNVVWAGSVATADFLGWRSI